MEKYYLAVAIILGSVAALLFFYCIVLRHSLKCLEKQVDRQVGWLAEDQKILDACLTEIARKIAKNDRIKLSDVYRHEFEALADKQAQNHEYNRRYQVVRKLYFYMNL